ncbi:hypothetical protein AAFF_G00073690 [Aldrovandia affinis]|uniref:Uncharacterized protein n=1 Tax=Aldrovandia affinis TaxID=143900 RepID=A0AAD7R3Q8_9TELE|nr:hypothetical protein AAFF_G00073690 [Aldrovandia affinis]
MLTCCQFRCPFRHTSLPSLSALQCISTPVSPSFLVRSLFSLPGSFLVCLSAPVVFFLPVYFVHLFVCHPACPRTSQLTCLQASFPALPPSQLPCPAYKPASLRVCQPASRPACFLACPLPCLPPSSALTIVPPHQSLNIINTLT